jgi:sulfite reductase (ferredoxin)
MINITDDNYKVIKEFKEKAEQYLKGEIDPLRFKAFRVSMGVYEQRTTESYMVRTRIPGGVITFEQFRSISKLAKKYSDGGIHFTTRQDVQFHNVKLQDIHKIMEALIEVGIITKGTGGNTVRNISCSPLSGVSSDEVFDVLPFVQEVTNYMIKDPSTMTLPRKFKIAFSNSSADTGNATIADLGFIAKISGGKKGFEVYGGGGFGGNPRVALKLEDFIEANDVIYYAHAMKNLFEKEGDRSNKHKARIRYAVNRLGEEKFIELFKEELSKLKSEKNLTLEIDIKAEDGKITVPSGVDKEFRNILLPEKEKGYFSLYIHPQSGNLKAESLDVILDFVDKLDYEVTARLTTTQGFFVRGLKETDVKNLIKVSESFSSKYDMYNSVACAGASTCQLGLCLSQNLLEAIRNEFENALDEVKDALPRLFISGCPNSCGQHQKGSIGFFGRTLRTADGLVPVYSVSFGGKVGSNAAKMGEVYGDIAAKKVPEYLVKLAELKAASGIEAFESFLKEKTEAVKDLTKEYGSMESFNDNPGLYYDFGSEERFSIKGRGAGECSAGVFDVIKLDLSNSENSLKKFNEDKSSSELYASAVSAARALLILKGVDGDKDRLIFKEFKTNFIDTGYVKKEIIDLFDTLLDFKLGDIVDISDKATQIQYLLNKVKAMFESLNGKLEITLEKEVESNAEEAASETKAFEVVDFRGVKCPINFVKVKIELSKIKAGDRRGFYLDDGEPIKNVPLSVQKEGHKIISIDTNFDGYNLLVVEK